MGQRVRNWQIQRQVLAKPRAWQRWDQAYQWLLQLSQTDQRPPEKSRITTHLRKENDDASSELCPCLDPAASRDPNP